MKKFILIRHPEINGVQEKRYFGFTDVQLSETGKAQAHHLVNHLKGESFEDIISSDLSRCLYPAQLLAQRFDLPLNIMPEWREIDFGQWEGLTIPEIEESFPKLLQLWSKNPAIFQFPKGESFNKFRLRILDSFKNLQNKSKTGSTLIFTHGGPIRVIISEILKLDMDCCWKIKQDYGAINIIENNEDFVSIRLLNDTCYQKK